MPNDRTRDVAVVGSPSTNTELTVDLLQEAIEERLVGALTSFEAVQNGQRITSVGQIVGIELKNRWHEDSVFRNLIKRTGEIPPITNRQDTRTADLVVGATFRQSANGFHPEVLGMVPLRELGCIESISRSLIGSWKCTAPRLSISGGRMRMTSSTRCGSSTLGVGLVALVKRTTWVFSEGPALENPGLRR